MRSKTKDNILLNVIVIIFFLNVFLPYLIDIVLIIEELVVVGWIILGIGAIFVLLSIITLRRKGTNNLIDSGIYGVVRHPMYLGGSILFLSHIFFFQNLIIATNAIIGIICCYLIILSGDQLNIEKFGEDYKRYMQKVPRTNFLIGLIRLLRRRKLIITKSNYL